MLHSVGSQNSQLRGREAYSVSTPMSAKGSERGTAASLEDTTQSYSTAYEEPVFGSSASRSANGTARHLDGGQRPPEATATTERKHQSRTSSTDQELLGSEQTRSESLLSYSQATTEDPPGQDSSPSPTESHSAADLPVQLGKPSRSPRGKHDKQSSTTLYTTFEDDSTWQDTDYAGSSIIDSHSATEGAQPLPVKKPGNVSTADEKKVTFKEWSTTISTGCASSSAGAGILERTEGRASESTSDVGATEIQEELGGHEPYFEKRRLISPVSNKGKTGKTVLSSKSLGQGRTISRHSSTGTTGKSAIKLPQRRESTRTGHLEDAHTSQREKSPSLRAKRSRRSSERSYNAGAVKKPSTSVTTIKQRTGTFGLLCSASDLWSSGGTRKDCRGPSRSAFRKSRSRSRTTSRSRTSRKTRHTMVSHPMPLPKSIALREWLMEDPGTSYSARENRRSDEFSSGIALTTDCTGSINNYSSWTTDLSLTPSLMSASVYPGTVGVLSGVSSQRSEYSEDPKLHRAGSRPRRRRMDEMEPSSHAFGDFQYEPKKKRKTSAFKRRGILMSSRVHDDGEHNRTVTEPLKTYIYHGYQVTGGRGKKTKHGQSRRSLTTGWYRKVRKSLSLGATRRPLDEENCVDGCLSFESTAAITEQPERPHVSKSIKLAVASESCPLPGRSTFSALEGIVPTPAEDVHPCYQEESYRSTTALDMPTAESLVDLCVERVPYLKRVVMNRRMIAYPSLTLAAVSMILGMIFVFSRGDIQAGELVSSDRNHSGYNASHSETDSPSTRGKPTEATGTCESDSCQRDGSYLKDLLSWESDPCDNFYHFACNKWRSTAPGATSRYGDSAASASGDLIHLLESRVLTLLKRHNSIEELQHIRNIFHECMNRKQLDHGGWSHVHELLWLAMLDGFPFHFTSIGLPSIWMVAARILRMTATETILSIRTVPHPQINKTIVAVSAPELLLTGVGNAAETINFYYDTTNVVLAVLKVQENSSNLSLDVSRFAAAVQVLASNHTLLYGPHKLTSLKTSSHLLAFVEEIFSDVNFPVFNGSQGKVLLECPDYIRQVSHLVASTEPHIVLNYFGVRLMIDVSAFLPSEGEPLVQVLVQHLYGRSRPFLPKWKLCVHMAERAVPLLFLRATELAYQTDVTIDSIKHYTRRILTTLVRSLDKLLILDEGTRLEAAKALNQSRISLFRPYWLADNAKLNAYVGGLPSVIRGQGLRSFYSLRGHSFTESLHQDHDHHWRGTAFDTDCTTDGRTVYVPILMFNLSLTNVGRDVGRDENFLILHAGTRLVRCLLRMILHIAGFKGHSHAGRRLWPDLGHSFLGSSKLCLHQYGVEGVDPLVLLESTASLRPVLDLYLAQTKYGVHFKVLQKYGVLHLFFVYYALGYCEENVSHNDTMGAKVPVAESLVNVPLWNSRRFQETFGCPVDSPMNPLKKCPLWREKL